MKRKLIQTERCDSESPPKLFHSENSRGCNNMELPDKSQCLGRPTLSSTPLSTVKYSNQRKNSIRMQHQHQQQEMTFDPAAEEELRRIVDNFVNIYEQLDKCSGSDVKPNYSYTELAYLAMLRSPNFCLPITEIYSYIQSRFLFFKNSTRKHWKNAVRHSLAKTLCFTKIPVGRGTSNSENLARSMYLWCILPGSIASFARGDYRPGVDKESGTNTLRWGYFQMNAGQFWDQVGNYISHKMAVFRKSLEHSPVPGSVFESQVCNLAGTNQSSLNNRPPLQHHQNSSSVLRSMNVTDVQCAQEAVSDFTTPYCNFVPLYLSRASSPQTRKSPTYLEDGLIASRSPNSLCDPWLPNMNLASPDSSTCSLETERRTPTSHSFDSGNETFESSPEMSSCRFYSARAAVSPPASGLQKSPQIFNDSGFQLELSPLGQIDFSNFMNDPHQSFDESKYIPSLSYGVGVMNAPMNYTHPGTQQVEQNNAHQYFPETFAPVYGQGFSYPQTSNACMAGVISNTMTFAW